MRRQTTQAPTYSIDTHLFLKSDADLKDAMVSIYSRWFDKAWFFPDSTPGSRHLRRRVSWDMELADGSLLTDEAYSEVLDWARRLTASLLAVNGAGRQPVRISTLASFITGLRILLIWMVANGYRRPSQLDRTALDQYARDLPELIADVHGCDDESDENDDDGPSESEVWRRIRVPKILWDQRRQLARAGIDPVPYEPWDGRSASDLTKEITKKIRGWIRPLPDEVSIPIMNAAADFLGQRAEDVIALHEACWLTYHRDPGTHKSGPGVTADARKIRQRKVARDFEFSRLPGYTEPWHPRVKGGRRPDGKPIRAMYELLRLVCSVRDAAVITILSSTGMRISELCALESGVDPISKLPSAVRIEESATGLNEVFLVTSQLVKGEAGPRLVEWVLAMRPKGSEVIPLPVQAMLILERLLGRYRTMANRSELVLSFSVPRGLPKSEDGVRSASGADLLKGMRRFIGEWVNLAELPDESRYRVEENDLVPWRDSAGAIIRTHQFRKFYAGFALSIDPRLLPAVQMHFHHLSQAMTEGGYWGSDRLQVEPLSTMQSQKTAAMIFEFATGRSLIAGKMGERIRENTKELQEILKSKSISDGWRETLRFIASKEIKMWFASYGACLPLAPMEMQCHKIGGTSSWFNKQPNYAVREPSVCVGCSCFVLDSRSEHVWKERYRDNRMAYRMAETQGSTSGFAVIRLRAQQAKAILSQLGVDVSAIDSEIDVLLESKRRGH